jgi:hypothetical protein
LACILRQDDEPSAFLIGLTERVRVHDAIGWDHVHAFGATTWERMLVVRSSSAATP